MRRALSEERLVGWGRKGGGTCRWHFSLDHSIGLSLSREGPSDTRLSHFTKILNRPMIRPRRVPFSCSKCHVTRLVSEHQMKRAWEALAHSSVCKTTSLPSTEHSAEHGSHSWLTYAVYGCGTHSRSSDSSHSSEHLSVIKESK